MMRFSFVRNPYARAVSCWADKFAGKPLAPGDFFIDGYLATRQQIDVGLPVGADRTLSFPEFVIFAATAANIHHDIHLQTQDDILNMPSIKLDLIGKVETFDANFVHVLDYLNASDDIRNDAAVAINESHHDDWPNYYTADLADRIYRAYESDFDRFGYARTFK
ncbi:MAG: sulfotransferase family 2 domain-containing protein [Pseudolabrys sp.]